MITGTNRCKLTCARRRKFDYTNSICRLGKRYVIEIHGWSASPNSTADNQTPAQAVELRGNIAPLSRATAVLLLVIYACYLFFQLKSHADMYSERSEKVPTIPINIPGRHRHADGETQRGISIMGAGSAAQAGGALLHNDNFMQTEQTKEEEEEQPQLSAIG